MQANAHLRSQLGRSTRLVRPGAIALLGVLLHSAVEFQAVAQVGSVVRHDSAGQASGRSSIVQPIYYPLNPRRPAGAAASSDLPEDLLRQFLEYHSAMKYDLAADAALRLVELAPDRPLAHYNLACAFAVLRQPDQAFEALNQAVNFGWRNVSHTLLDPDLRSLRQDDRFVELIATMRRRINAERLLPVPLRVEAAAAIRDDLRAFAGDAMTRHFVPGMAVAFIDQGDVAWTECFGVADASTDVPLKIDQLFRVDGARDLLALIAALQQESKGNLNLAEVLEHRRQSLASHQSRDGAPSVFPAGSNRSGDPAQQPPASSAMDLTNDLGFYEAIIGAAANVDFAAYCERNILAPLQLERPQLGPVDRNAPAVAVGHSVFGTPVQPSSAAAQCAVATADDLARLAAALAPIDNARSSANIRLDDVKNVGHQVHAMNVGLGLRVAVEATRFGTRIQLLDQADGVGCLIRAFPESGRGVVILFNSETGAPCAEAVAHHLLGGM